MARRLGPAARTVKRAARRGCIIGAGVDVASGATLDIAPNPVDVKLERLDRGTE
jgi:hypothetical protein